MAQDNTETGADDNDDIADTGTGDEAGDEAGRPGAPDWLIGFKTGAFPEGSYCAGRGFSTVFSDRGSEILVVSFDNLSQVREEIVGRSPWGYSFVAKNGWSQLGVMSDSADWFRNPALFDHLKGLAETGFFTRFRKVVMTGTSMGGYAACAFAGLAPGCTVLAFSPQSSLKKDLVPWETRYASGRRADWSGEFADAAVDSAAASAVYLIYDPLYPEDVRHIDRFTGPNVVRLKARYAGHKTALFLRRAGGLSEVVRSVVETEMTAATFARIYRQGRSLPWYMHGVRNRITGGGRDRLLPAFASAVRKMGFEQIARSAGAAPLPPAAGKGAGTAQAGAKPAKRNGPHEQRLAARAAAGKAAPAAAGQGKTGQGKTGLGKAGPGKAGAKPQAPQPEVITEDPRIDLYASAPDLPPLTEAGDLPWQLAQRASRKGLPGTQGGPTTS